MDYLSPHQLATERLIHSSWTRSRLRNLALSTGCLLLLHGPQAQADFSEKWGVAKPVAAQSQQAKPIVSTPNAEAAAPPADATTEVLATVPEASESSIPTVRSTAQIYRWVDTAGKVHFGDFQSLPEQAQEIVELKHPQPKLNPQAPNQPVAQALAAHSEHSENNIERPDVEVVEAAAKRDRRKEARLCERAQTNLMNVRSLMRAGYKASQYDRLRNSERTYMDQRSQHCR